MLVLDVCTLISVTLDEANVKDVVAVQDIRLSAYKDLHPSDSEDNMDIGLSSEDEAEDLDEQPFSRRKYHQPAPPPPAPEPQPTTSSDTGTTTTSSTSVQVPMEALQQVHQYLNQLLAGGPPPPGGIPPPQPPAPVPEDVPFSIPQPQKGQKVCTICQRKFWSPQTLKSHMSVHTGEQNYICPNAGCGRKLTSKRSHNTHMSTCQKEKVHFCKKKDCDKRFATRAALTAHTSTHKKLKKGAGVCPSCGKAGFTKQKSVDDHHRTCASNPNRVGPFPCRVPGCRRGPNKPFTRIRNLNPYVHFSFSKRHNFLIFIFP